MPWEHLPDRLAHGIVELEGTLREIRHDLHAHPELGFEEHRTQQEVEAWLQQHGYRTRRCARTGVIADLRPDLHGERRTVAIRADLDALPIHETTDLAYRSVHDGVAHKCGHDGHTTIVLGLAAILARVREHAPANVRLLFQPAEEGKAGAKSMREEGALEGVSEIYGLHNWPGFPRGEVRVKSGAMMAATHGLWIRLHGKGGHGSQPHTCRDPIVASAQVITALQTVVSRGPPGAVVSVCSIHAGNTHNVIPDQAELLGTIRTFDPEVARDVLGRIEQVVTGTARAMGVRAEIELAPGYPVLNNDDQCSQRVRRAAERVVGPDRLLANGLPLTAAEDFAFFTETIPGAYFFLGAGRSGGETPGCHHPDFDFDDELIPVGIRMFGEILREAT